MNDLNKLFKKFSKDIKTFEEPNESIEKYFLEKYNTEKLTESSPEYNHIYSELSKNVIDRYGILEDEQVISVLKIFIDKSNHFLKENNEKDYVLLAFEEKSKFFLSNSFLLTCEFVSFRGVSPKDVENKTINLHQYLVSKNELNKLKESFTHS